MAIKVRDNFDRPDGPLGGFWQVLRGGVTVKGNRAFATNATPGSIAVVDAGSLGQDTAISCVLSYANIYEGGHAIYARVVDADNWWRYSVRRDAEEYSYQVQVGTETYVAYYEDRPVYDYVYVRTDSVYVRTDTVYVGERQVYSHDEVVHVGWNYYCAWDNHLYNGGQYHSTEIKWHYYPTPGYPQPNNYDNLYATNVRYGYTEAYETRAVYKSESVYEQRDVYENRDVYEQQIVGYQSYPVYATRPVYSTVSGTNYFWELQLSISVTGVISVVSSARTPANEQPTSLQLSVRKDLIDCYFNNKNTAFMSVTDTRYNTATKHGLGYSEVTDYGNTQGMDNFVMSPDFQGFYVPAIML